MLTWDEAHGMWINLERYKMTDTPSSRDKFEANLTPGDIEYLDHAFNYHKPPDHDIVDMHEQVRESCRRIAAMALHLPGHRERSLALTKLEEAMMWLNACIARNHGAIQSNLRAQRNLREQEAEAAEAAEDAGA